MMMLTAVIAFPVILLACLCSLKTVSQYHLEKEQTSYAEKQLATAPLNNQLSSRELDKMVFAKRLNEFLLYHFPGMVRYYTDNPCGGYDTDIFYVNVVYPDGGKKKVFIEKKPSLYGASFQFYQPDTPSAPAPVPVSSNPDTPAKAKKKKAPEKKPEETETESPTEKKDSTTSVDSSWIKKNLPKMLSLMEEAKKRSEDVFVFQVPDNDEIREALEYEGLYVIANDETNETYVSF